MKSLSEMTRGDLPAGARSALQLLATHKGLRRIKGAWYAPGRKVTLGTAETLQLRGLARETIENGQKRLVITGSGKILAEAWGGKGGRA